MFGFVLSSSSLIAAEFVWTGTPCFRGHGRRNGERRRKSVRGCIVSPDLSVLNLVIVKKGDNDLPGLTDVEKPRMRGPKRASKIRKLFNLSKDDDVRKYVNTYRRNFTSKTGEFADQFINYYPCQLRTISIHNFIHYKNVCILSTQERIAAKLPRFRGWWLLWLYKGSEQGLQTRRRELLSPSQLQRSTRSFLPLGWRSSVNAVVRAWQRGDPSSLQLLSHLGLLRFSMVFIWYFFHWIKHVWIIDRER